MKFYGSDTQYYCKLYYEHKNEVLKHRSPYYIFCIYYLMIFLMLGTVGYQFYFNPRFDRDGITIILFYFLNIMLDGFLLNETIHCSYRSYLEIDLSVSYFLMTISL